MTPREELELYAEEGKGILKQVKKTTESILDLRQWPAQHHDPEMNNHLLDQTWEQWAFVLETLTRLEMIKAMIGGKLVHRVIRLWQKCDNVITTNLFYLDQLKNHLQGNCSLTPSGHRPTWLGRDDL